MRHDAGFDIGPPSQDECECVQPFRRDLIELDQQPVVSGPKDTHAVFAHGLIISELSGPGRGDPRGASSS